MEIQIPGKKRPGEESGGGNRFSKKRKWGKFCYSESARRGEGGKEHLQPPGKVSSEGSLTL